MRVKLRPRIALASLVALGLALVACNAPTAPTSIVGSWTSKVPPYTPGPDFSMSLQQSGDSIIGTAAFQPLAPHLAVAGRYARPKVTLFLKGPGINETQFVGRLVSGSEMRGVFTDLLELTSSGEVRLYKR